MDPLTILLLIGIIIIIGLIGELIFRRTGVPDVIILLLFGVFVNTYWGGGQEIGSFAPVIAPLALMILLFEGGLRMRIHEITHDTPRAALLAFTGFTLCVAASSILMNLMLGWDFLSGAILGAIVGGSSSAIVLGIVRNINSKNKELADVLSVESVITDVLCIVVTISLLQTIAYINNDPLMLGRQILGTISIGLFVGFIIGIAWLKILTLFRELPYQHMVTLAIVFIIYVFSELFGGSGAIAALFFGLVLGNSNEIANMLRIKNVDIDGCGLRRFQSEIAFFVRTFFFVYLGLVVSISNIFLVLVGVVLTVLLFAGRYLAVRIATLGSELSGYVNVMTFIAPRGLAAAVLAQIPMAYGLKNGLVFVDITFVVLITTIIISSLEMFVQKPKKSKLEK